MAIENSNKKIVRSKKYLIYLIIVLMFVEILDTFTTNFPNVIPSKVIEEFLSTYPENVAKSIYAFCAAIATLGTYIVFFNQFLADKVGRKVLLVITVLGMGVTSLLIIFSANIIQYTIFLFLLFIFFNSDMWVIYINEESPSDKRARLTNLVLIGGVTGSILLPIIRTIVLPSEATPASAWRGMPIFAVLLGIPLSLIILFTIKETSKYEEIKNKKKRKEHLESSLIKENLRTIFQSHRRKEFITILIISLFVGFNYNFVSLGESYINSSPNLSENDINLIILVMSISVVFGYLFTGIFADKYGRKPLFYVYSALVPISIFIVISGSQLSENAIIPVCIGAGLINIAYWGLGVILRIVTLEILPTNARGTGGGFKSLIQAIGVTLGLVFSGIITLFLKQEMAFIIMSLFLLINLPLIYFYIKETKGIDLSTIK